MPRASTNAAPNPNAVFTLHDMLRVTSEAFVNADLNGDKELSFEEFVTIVPASVRAGHTETTLRELFQSADTDRSGEISLDEYLYFSLRWAAFDSGMCSAFKSAFVKFDTRGDDELNLAEFSKAVEVRPARTHRLTSRPFLRE